MGNTGSSNKPAFEYLKTQTLEETGFGHFFEVSLAKRQAQIVAVSNEQFGKAENLLKTSNANNEQTLSEGTQDGWQVSRHLNQATQVNRFFFDNNTTVHIRLCGSCKIKGVDIDTRGYTNGSSALVIELDGFTYLDEKRTWINIIPRTKINENMHNFFSSSQSLIYDTLRLTVLPGGGVSRFRAYGEVVPTPVYDGVDRNMASGGLGAQVVHWSGDFNINMSDILFDGDGTEKSGWLTPRSRGYPRNDHVIIKLAAVAMINRAIINTKPFSDKTPKAVSLDACCTNEDNPLQDKDVVWYPLIKQEPIQPDREQTLPCVHPLPVSHVRLTLIPDGGIQQIKVIGYACYNAYNVIMEDNELLDTDQTCMLWESSGANENTLSSGKDVEEDKEQEIPVENKVVTHHHGDNEDVNDGDADVDALLVRENSSTSKEGLVSRESSTDLTHQASNENTVVRNEPNELLQDESRQEPVVEEEHPKPEETIPVVADESNEPESVLVVEKDLVTEPHKGILVVEENKTSSVTGEEPAQFKDRSPIRETPTTTQEGEKEDHMDTPPPSETTEKITPPSKLLLKSDTNPTLLNYFKYLLPPHKDSYDTNPNSDDTSHQQHHKQQQHGDLDSGTVSNDGQSNFNENVNHTTGHRQQPYNQSIFKSYQSNSHHNASTNQQQLDSWLLQNASHPNFIQPDSHYDFLTNTTKASDNKRPYIKSKSSSPKRTFVPYQFKPPTTPPPPSLVYPKQLQPFSQHQTTIEYDSTMPSSSSNSSISSSSSSSVAEKKQIEFKYIQYKEKSNQEVIMCDESSNENPRDTDNHLQDNIIVEEEESDVDILTCHDSSNEKQELTANGVYLQHDIITIIEQDDEEKAVTCHASSCKNQDPAENHHNSSNRDKKKGNLHSGTRTDVIVIKDEEESSFYEVHANVIVIKEDDDDDDDEEEVEVNDTSVTSRFIKEEKKGDSEEQVEGVRDTSARNNLITEEKKDDNEEQVEGVKDTSTSSSFIKEEKKDDNEEQVEEVKDTSTVNHFIKEEKNEQVAVAVTEQEEQEQGGEEKQEQEEERAPKRIKLEASPSSSIVDNNLVRSHSNSTPRRRRRDVSPRRLRSASATIKREKSNSASATPKRIPMVVMAESSSDDSSDESEEDELEESEFEVTFRRGAPISSIIPTKRVR